MVVLLSIMEIGDIISFMCFNSLEKDFIYLSLVYFIYVFIKIRDVGLIFKFFFLKKL